MEKTADSTRSNRFLVIGLVLVLLLIIITISAGYFLGNGKQDIKLATKETVELEDPNTKTEVLLDISNFPDLEGVELELNSEAVLEFLRDYRGFPDRPLELRAQTEKGYETIRVVPKELRIVLRKEAQEEEKFILNDSSKPYNSYSFEWLDPVLVLYVQIDPEQLEMDPVAAANRFILTDLYYEFVPLPDPPDPAYDEELWRLRESVQLVKILE